MEQLGVINSTPKVNFGNEQMGVTPNAFSPQTKLSYLPDSVEFTTKESAQEPKEKLEESPQIGFFRLAFKRLTQEQIDAINGGAQLPSNAKFHANIEGQKYTIGNKILGITQGTRTLPAGFEVRKSWLGFTAVVPKDTEGWFLRKKPTEAE